MRRAAIVVVGLLLAGCAPVPPAGPTMDQIRSFQAAEALSSWQDIFPGEPMPQVQVVATIAPQEQDRVLSECLDAAVSRLTSRPPVLGELQWARWTCTEQYPIDPAQDGRFLSPDQLEYGYEYLVRRSIPCLRSLGVAYTAPPIGFFAGVPFSGEGIAPTDDGRPWWSPYWTVADDALSDVLEACPPPPGQAWTQR